MNNSFLKCSLFSLVALPIIAASVPLENLAQGQSGKVEFNSITPQTLWTFARKNLQDTKNTVVSGDLLLPKNVVGRIPALVLSHGSTGVNPSAYEVWAAKINDAGIAIFIVDSFKPRGINNTANDQFALSPAANTADALNALRLLATHPSIDPKNIFHIGFSRGGGAAIYTAWPIFQEPINTNGIQFSGHIAVYPAGCNIRYRGDSHSQATAPIFFATADKDKEDWVGSKGCEEYAKDLAKKGNDIKYKEYPGTYHGFDGKGKFSYFPNAQSSKNCDMELQMTNIAGSGLGREAKDFKSGKTLSSFTHWDEAVKNCSTYVNSRLGGDDVQSSILVADVLEFIKKLKK
jgi:dienelactone hydrolase